MRFTIVGAGAIGGVVGAHLIQAGHEVGFVEVVPEHVEAIRANGLRVSGHADLHVRPPIATPDGLTGPIDHLLLAVKSRHTEQALAPLVPALAADGYVVSLQNGLEEYKIARLVGEGRTIGAFLTFGGHYLRPGEVVYGGPGSFGVGELDGRRSARVESLRDALSCLQRVEVTDNIFGYLWSKMALGAVYFATALVSADVVEILEHARYRDFFADAAAEVVAVAAAAGVRCGAFDGFDPNVFGFDRPRDPARVAEAWDAQRRYWGGHVQQRTGVWRDLAIHKRKTEVEDLVGAVIGRADALGVPVTRLREIVRLVREVESGTRELGWHNLDELSRGFAAAGA